MVVGGGGGRRLRKPGESLLIGESGDLGLSAGSTTDWLWDLGHVPELLWTPVTSLESERWGVSL